VRKLILIAGCGAAFFLMSCGAPTKSPDTLLNKYFDFLVDGQIAKANQFWQDNELLDSTLCDWHFTSPNDTLISLFSESKKEISRFDLDSNSCKLVLQLIPPYGDPLRLTYYSIRMGQGWKLVNPDRIICTSWDSLAYKNVIMKYPSNRPPDELFFRVVSSSYLHIGTLLRTKDTSGVRIFLASSPQEMTMLLDDQNPPEFWSSLAGKIVIHDMSRNSGNPDASMVNARRIVRQLVGVIARSVYGHDSRAVPFIRDGLAAYFGGWEDFWMPELTVDAAENIEDIPSLTVLLENKTIDMNQHLYAAASGAFTEFLIGRYGWDKYDELYIASSSLENLLQKIESVGGVDTLDESWRDSLRTLKKEIDKRKLKSKV